jgi:hypothetical protein
MEIFVKELIDSKKSELETITELVINTIKANALYKKGGWKLVESELGNRYMNPNFALHYGTIRKLLDDLKIEVGLSIKDELPNIARMVNEKIGIEAVRYEVDRLAHYLKIII